MNIEVILLNLVRELNSSVFVLLVILIGAFYLSNKLSVKLGQWYEKFAHHEDRLNHLQGMSDKIIELNTKVTLIYQNTNPNKLAAANSPISLTPAGEDVSTTVGAAAILEKHIDALISKVELEGPINAYDIQVVSMKVTREEMLSLLDEKDLNIIKSKAYSIGVLIEDVMIIFGVLLRNQILKNRGIPIADVDKHATKES